jgi:mannosyl-3-phosphoglycerate phosphatase
MKQWIIFTDLDGTLLDSRTYSFAPALPALRLLSDMNIPLVLSSSKTRTEIEYYREKLDNHHPFISENGGGIFMPKNYFVLRNEHNKLNIFTKEYYDVIALGAPYNELRKALRELQSEGFQVKGFGDMSTEEVAATTGLSMHEAAMARERNFDEPFIVQGNDPDIGKLLAGIESKGLRYTEGKMLHIMGNSDKGCAVSILCDLYRKKYGEIVTVALGDSPNDIPMLEAVDYPVIVQKPDRKHDPRIDLPKLIRAEGTGPTGWNKAVSGLISSSKLTKAE